MTEYTKGDYTSCYTSICEIWKQTDEDDEELYATVRLEDADKIISVLNENEELKSRIVDYDKALKTLQDLTDRKLKENEQLKKELELFKPVMFQDMRKGTVILYRKGDVE